MNIRNMKTTALTVGSTSALALIAAASSSLAQDGLYMGLAMGTVHGANPSPGDGAGEDYSMSGSSVSAFIGIQRDMANGMFGGVELAYTGPSEGDKDQNSSYEYAYDTNYTIDAKVRLGKHMGSMDVYGFGGLSTGSASTCCYGVDYRFNGVNVGIGAQMNIADNMFGGVEYIHRFTQGTENGDNGYNSSHGTLSLRIGYKF